MFARTTKFAIAALAVMFANTLHAAPIWMTGDDGQNLYTVDSNTGAGALVGNFGQSDTYTLAFSQNGTLYGISNGFSNGTLVTIDRATGHATTVGVSTGVGNMMSLAFAQDGTLYAGSWSNNNLYTINASTGAASLVGNLGFGGIMDLDFDSQGNLYALSDALYRVDRVTGHGTLVSNLANTCLMGMAIDAADRFLATDYCSNNSPLYQVNTSNGALTNLGASGIGRLMGGAIAPVNVPEPGTVVLLGLAIAGLMVSRLRIASNSKL